MISQTLRDARRYEDAMAQNITPLERPEFHLSPKVGWMNDPNGFSYYKDKFHLFYQYYPYDSHQAVDDIRRRFGYFSVQKAFMYQDKALASLDAQSSHTVHPIGYFNGR